MPLLSTFALVLAYAAADELVAPPVRAAPVRTPVGRDRLVPVGSGGFDLAGRIALTANGDVVLCGVAGEPGLFVGLDAMPVTSGSALGPREDPLGEGGGSFIVRLAADGRTRWVRTGRAGNLEHAVELSDGRLLVVGRASDGPVGLGEIQLQVREWSNERNGWTRGENAIAYWLDERGRAVAGKSYGDNGLVAASTALALEDGAALIGGYVEGVIDGVASGRAKSGAGPNGEWDDGDGFLLAVDRAGSVQWRAFVDGTGQDQIQRLARTADGDLLVGGTTRETATFVDGTGKKLIRRCGYPVQCPFVWRLDATTGSSKGVVVLGNGSGMPDVAALVPLDDGGVVALGEMGRNLRVASAATTAGSTQVTLRAESAVGHVWAARWDRAMKLRWAVRVDEKGDAGGVSGAVLGTPGELLVAGVGALATAAPAAARRGEGPAVLARLSLESGAPLASLAFGKPADAPLTSSGFNIRIVDIAASGADAIAVLTSVQERAFFTLDAGPIEMITIGTRLGTNDRYANEMDLAVLLLHDIGVLATPAVPFSVTAARTDPIVGCVAKKSLSLLVPCEPTPRELRPGRDIHHTCIEGTWDVGDRRVWSCGPLDDDIALAVDGRELIFREASNEGRLVLYQDIASGHRKLTAQLLDTGGKPVWSRALEGYLKAAASSWIDDVVLRGDTLYLLEICSGYRKQHQDRCDRIVALDPRSGATRWTTSNGVIADAIKFVGDRHLVGTANDTVSLIDAASGRVLDALKEPNASEVQVAADGDLRVLHGGYWESERNPVLIRIVNGKLVRSR